MTTAPETLTRLAQRFDERASSAALVGDRKGRAAATRSAAQLRNVAARTMRGEMSITDAWHWADAAAGQLGRTS